MIRRTWDARGWVLIEDDERIVVRRPDGTAALSVTGRTGFMHVLLALGDICDGGDTDGRGIIEDALAVVGLSLDWNLMWLRDNRGLSGG